MAVTLPVTLSDHPSLVGIIRFPRCFTMTEEVAIPIVIKIKDNFMAMRQLVDMATIIRSEETFSKNFNIPKSKITDFFPYTYYVLTDGEGEPLILHPQYLPNNIMVKGQYALSHQPVEKYFIPNYKGDKNGLTYNITNLNQMMLPTATNEGINYMNANANTIMQNRKSQVTGNILNGVMGVASTLTGFSPMGAMQSGSNIISGINSIKQTDARNKDMQLTPNSISSFGSPSTRSAFGTDNVRLIRYTVQENIKTKVLNYVDRYGNKFNNYDTIDIKNYKGYVKFIEPSITTKIDSIFANKIREILERGVFVE